MTKNQLIGTVPLQLLSGELNTLTQGGDKLILPALWPTTLNVAIDRLGIFFLTTPTTTHSFTFFKNGASIGVVSVTASGNFWTAAPTAPFSLKGMTDYISIRHDTNGQDGHTEASHVNEGARIWATLLTQQVVI